MTWLALLGFAVGYWLAGEIPWWTISTGPPVRLGPGIIYEMGPRA